MITTKNEYLISAKKTNYAESDVISITLKPDTSTSSSSSSDTKVSKADIKKQEERNYQSYLDELAKASTTTKGALTKAYYEKNGSYVVLVLNDAALNNSSNSVKTIAKAAWNAGDRLYNQYKPFPTGIYPNMIHVEDSQGNVIAKIGFTGSLKYTGE